jgi:hypothetical protein
MKLLSKELVSLDYREHLQRDLAKATVCRFLVAYISGEGMSSIGRHLLNRVLRDQRSFGIASLTCSCGFDSLFKKATTSTTPLLVRLHPVTLSCKAIWLA